MHVESSVVIAHDVADVCTFTDDPAHEPVWWSISIDAAFISEGPPCVGTTGRESARWLGGNFEGEWVITAYEYEAVPDGMRFTIVVDAPDNNGLFGRLSDSLVARI